MYKRLKKIKKLLPLYIMALPALVYLFINNYLPLTGMVVAFKDFDYSKGIYGSDWAGFRNFLFLFKNSVAFIITRNTISVSYTHLDVYKRQKQERPRACLPVSYSIA